MYALKLTCFVNLLIITKSTATGKTSQSNADFEKRVDHSHFTNMFSNIPEDALLPITKLIPKYGYPLEIHKVATRDGYILTVHRIPHGKKPHEEGVVRPAVLMMHGLIQSSDDWIVLGPKQGLGYILADAGYDVWMGNVRGNKHSKEHLKLSPKRLKFWDFSLDEISLIDVPAMIDYVIDTSGNRMIYYIGFSQGTIIFLTLHSARPEYNQKIKKAILLAPVAFANYTKSEMFISFLKLSRTVQKTLFSLGKGELLPYTHFMSLLSEFFCNKQFPFIAEFCLDAIFTISGFDSSQVNISTLPIILGHSPSGCSTKQWVHYDQMYRARHLRMFDYGKRGNLRRYNSSQPPDYNLDNIVAPVLLMNGKNDWLADPEDVELLYKRLRNADKYLVPYKKFNHNDFLYANDVRKLVYDKVLDAMNKC